MTFTLLDGMNVKQGIVGFVFLDSRLRTCLWKWLPNIEFALRYTVYSIIRNNVMVTFKFIYNNVRL